MMCPWVRDVGSIYWKKWLELDRADLMRYAAIVLMSTKFFVLFVILPIVLGCYGWMRKFGGVGKQDVFTHTW